MGGSGRSDVAEADPNEGLVDVQAIEVLAIGVEGDRRWREGLQALTDGALKLVATHLHGPQNAAEAKEERRRAVLP